MADINPGVGCGRGWTVAHTDGIVSRCRCQQVCAARSRLGPPPGMLFNSLSFAVFFPVVTVLYFALPHRWRNGLLLVASCIFYCAAIPAFLLILWFTIVVDYFAALLIESSTGPQRKRYLTLSICANVGVLAVFKYGNFIWGNLALLF